jgi:hypothetical protein
MTTEIADALRGLGLCASREALDALLGHATKGRLSPAEVVEHIVRLERRERDARNLASCTKRATLGAMKSLDRFDWSFPRAIDRPRYEQLLSLDFTAHGHNVLEYPRQDRGQCGSFVSTCYCAGDDDNREPARAHFIRHSRPLLLPPTLV